MQLTDFLNSIICWYENMVDISEEW